MSKQIFKERNDESNKNSQKTKQNTQTSQQIIKTNQLFMNSQFARISHVRRDNSRLERIIENYLEQIQKQKQLNLQRENQIESLLKFNQRLLNIIETQMGNSRRDNGSLMPISEKSERQSDLMNPMNSLIRTKRTIAARSQKGTKSVIENHTYLSRLQALGKNLQHSEFIRSEDVEDSFVCSVKNKSHYRMNTTAVENDRKYSDMTTKIESQISNELKKMSSCAQKNNNFYEDKINQLKNLGNKIGTYKPQEKFDEIAKKIPMSAGTANLVKKAMMAKKV